MERATPEQPNQQLGNYDLLAKIGEGGMGWVYKARHRESGQMVAIKIMPAHLAANPLLLQRFEKEWRAASSIDHPHIVKALEYCGTCSTPFLVMEFVDGESVGQKIQRDGPLSEAEAVRLIVQTAEGLYQAHKKGMIHRDIKPDNILVTREGTAKLTDLGLVKDLYADWNLTRTGSGLGTPNFMAPEQFRDAKNACVKCDIYSLGATLYMMVTGEVPFGKTSTPLEAYTKKANNDLVPPRQLVPTLSERVEAAIRRSMNNDPAQRPASCREFIADLLGTAVQKSGESPRLDLWFLTYKDRNGATQMLKGTTEVVRRSIQEGVLGDPAHVRVSRTKHGPFELLKALPEFCDLMPPAANG